MFGLSFFELLAIFGVALLVFGPEKLPEFAKTLGKISGDIRRTSDSVRREFYNSVYPPAEDLQSSYRKLIATPLIELEGTCEQKEPTHKDASQELHNSNQEKPDLTKPDQTKPDQIKPDQIKGE